VRSEPVFVEQIGVAKQLCELLSCLRVVSRTKKAQHDPASRRDLQVEAAARDRGGTEPGRRIAQGDLMLEGYLILGDAVIEHGMSHAIGSRPMTDLRKNR
jgi:hypothetical protein